MPTPSTPVLSVRVNPHERALLEQAAKQAHTNVSDFMRRKALEAAEIDVLEHRIVTIPAAEWEKFEAWMTRPPETIPALQQLASLSPAWQD